MFYIYMKYCFIHSGSFATATCMVCKYKVDKEVVKADIMDQVKNCFLLNINENLCLQNIAYNSHGRVPLKRSTCFILYDYARL